MMRERDGAQLHDGNITDPSGCPRERGDCTPLARYASPGFESFMCCGQTSAAPVPTDRLRLCVKSTHDQSPVDLLVNFDERDAVHTATVLMAGLSSLGSVQITATDTQPGGPMPSYAAVLRREPEPPCQHDGGRTWTCKTTEHADTCTGTVLRIPYTVETCNKCGAELASWARSPFDVGAIPIPAAGPQPEEGRDGD